jgi:hypothetical protein
MAFIEIIKQPLYGSVYWNDAEFIYTPNVGFSGNDSFIYKQIEGSRSIIYTKFVNAYNRPPISNIVELSTNVSSTLKLNISSLVTDLTNPFDELTIIDVKAGNYGSAYTDGQNLYYDSYSKNGIDNILYTVSDKQYNTTGVVVLSVLNELVRTRFGTVKQRADRVEGQLNLVTVLSVNYETLYSFITANTSNLNTLDITRWHNYSTIAETISSSLIDLYDRTDEFSLLYNTLTSNSGNWISDTSLVTLVCANSATWVESYNNTVANESRWDTNTSKIQQLSSVSEEAFPLFDSYYNTVCSFSSNWDSTETNTILSSHSAKWMTYTDTVTTKSIDWQFLNITTDNLSTSYYYNSIGFNEMKNAILSNFSGWNDRIYSIACTLSANSANWDSILEDKTELDTQVSLVSSLSPNWVSDEYTSEDLKNVITLSGQDWSSTADIIDSKYNTWDELSTKYYDISSFFPLLDGVYNLIQSNSSKWKSSDLNALLSIEAPKWQEVYKLSNSSYSLLWDYTYNIINALSTQYYITDKPFFDDFYTYLNQTSSNYFYTDINTLVSAGSAQWEYTKSILSDNIDYWNNIYETTNYFLSDFKNDVYNSVYNIIIPAYIQWESKKENMISLLSANSGKWDLMYKNISTYNVLYTVPSAWANDVSTALLINDLITLSSEIYDANTEIVATSGYHWTRSSKAVTEILRTLIVLNSVYDIVHYVAPYWGAIELGSTVGTFSANYDYIYQNLPYNYDYISNQVNILTTGYYNVTNNYLNPSYNLVKTLSNDWFTYKSRLSSLLLANSGNWETIYQSKSTFDNLTETVDDYKSKWISSFDFADKIYQANTVLSSTSADWQTISQQQSVFDSMYSIIRNNSSNYISNLDWITKIYEAQTILSSASADWVSIYNSKPIYDKNYTFILANSSSFSQMVTGAPYINSLILQTQTISSSLNDGYIKIPQFENMVNIIRTYSGGWTVDFKFVDNINSANLITRNNGDSWNTLYRSISTYDFLNSTVSSTSAYWLQLKDISFGDIVYDAKTILSSCSSNWDSLNNLNSDNTVEYLNAFNNQIGAISSDYFINSSNYSNASTAVSSASAKWLYRPDYTSFETNSANWQSTANNFVRYNNNSTYISALCANYPVFIPVVIEAKKEADIWSAYTDFIYLSGLGLNQNTSLLQSISYSVSTTNTNYDSLYQTVTTYNTIWDIDYLVRGINLWSPSWDKAYDVIFVDDFGSIWDSNITDAKSLCAVYYNNKNNKFLSVSSTVYNQQSSWEDTSIVNLLCANSSIWTEAYNTASAITGSWYFNEDDTYKTSYSYFNANSGALNDGYNLIVTNSGNWLSSVELLFPLTANAVSGAYDINLAAKYLIVYGDALINGTLTAAHLLRFASNIINLTSLVVNNSSNRVAALSVASRTPYVGVTHFRTASSSVLYINTQTGTLGVNISSIRGTTNTLTISGDLSAFGYITPYASQFVTTYTAKSGTYLSNYSYLTSNSATFTEFVSSYPKYDIIKSYVRANSGSYNTINSPSVLPIIFNQLSDYNYKTQYLSSYISVSGDSFGVDTRYRDNSGSYEDLYNYVNTTSSQVASSYQISYVFGYNAIRSRTYGLYNVNDDITIQGWTIYSDQPTFASIDILSGTYNNYPRTSSIIGNNIPHLDNTNPIFNYGIANPNHWRVNINRNSILKFVLQTNSAANYILINLRVTKR